MKRLVAAILVLTILSLCLGSLAESIDFSAYTDEQLLDLHAQIQQEITDRKIEKSAELLPGKYVAGKDLPTGTYILYMNYKEATRWGEFYVIESEGNKKQIYDGHIYAAKEGEDNDKSWVITLDEGNVLYCSYPVTLTVYTGIQFK